MFARRTAWRWAVVLIPAIALYWLPLAGFNDTQRHLLAVFAGTIIALVAQPVPMGASVLIAMTILALARVLPPAKVLSGFANVTVWLIFTAFLFARAVTTTGFGLRVACFLIARFGRSPLTIAYCVAAANVTLAPFVPSDTARGGGVIFPITRGLTQAFGAEPASANRGIGAFLILAAFHANYTASAMFLTGMVANPLIAEFARKIANVDITWLQWAAGSSLPGLLTLLAVPLLLLRFAPPGVEDMGPARAFARAELQRIGAMTRPEWTLVAVLLTVMIGWVSSPWHGISNTIVAMAGLCALLLLGVLSWDDLLSERRAWDALVWFAPLIMMSEALTDAGVIRIVADSIFTRITGWPWELALVALLVAYLYAHYMFASLTAHATAMYPPFLSAALSAGVPPLVASLPLAYFSSLYAGLTHYGTGSAPVFFGPGFVTQSAWWRVGFVISVTNLAIWLGAGLLWWKLIGLW